MLLTKIQMGDLVSDSWLQISGRGRGGGGGGEEEGEGECSCKYTHMLS